MGQPIARETSVYASSIGRGSSVPADVDDWEYEYDENETEDFYFTLDLTTHVPNALLQAETSLQGYHKTTLNGSARRSAAVDTPDGRNADSSDEYDEPSAGQLQIVDLHTARPLVKLDENVYNCAWSTDLGTQFHIAKAGEIRSKVRRVGTVLDIIGTSQTRLLGIPVTLQPRNDVHSSRTPGAAANNALSVDGETGSEIDADEASERLTPALPSGVAEPRVPLQIDRARVKHQAGAQQASFLERLSQIKLKKGESDQVPIYSVKQYHHIDPARQAALKQAGRALDAQRKAKAKEDEVVATGQHPRKRRRKLTHAEKGVERGNQAGAGRQARDAVAQRLGFSDDAPPSNRNGRWARQPPPAENMAYSTSDAPGSTPAGQELVGATMSARPESDATTSAMPVPANSAATALQPHGSTTTPTMPAVANSGSAVAPAQDSNERFSPREAVDAPDDPI
ncbi:hypothetical protein DOTSEDRAFT_73119 [Dothistroma septosporum NZE10]|uniref:Transcription factor TFIIIC triple barrel domain-containing protein n=1 Tax=Dothistroma septosporum (strain NZE10 / CBS 128990) TaxID=675120 RepID=N1PHX8_DOTSN|nr:hypothetical protein DOTSEDRAFT_73119 [Dothistroma septosporum NZE10]